MNFVFFPFNKYKKNIFFFFGCWLLLEIFFSFCPKNNGFARVWGAAAPFLPSTALPLAKCFPTVCLSVAED